jgi:predicted permease
VLLRIVAIVFPIFAVVAAGYLYARWRRPDMGFANQLNMDVFVPALVFSALASRPFDIDTYGTLGLAAALVVLGSGLLALPVARLLRVETNTFVPPMMFTNSGNMGLPLMVLAFGEAALPAAVMLFLVENVLHYSLGTWMLDHHARLTTIWRIPVIAAAIAGLAVSLTEIRIWPPALTAVRMLGEVSIPLLLFSLGVRLTDSAFGDLRLGVIGAVFCPLSGVVTAWLAAYVLGIDGMQRDMLIVFGALPPAVLNYVFAERYRQEPQKVASIVMVGNLGSLVAIPLALAIVL